MFTVKEFQVTEKAEQGVHAYPYLRKHIFDTYGAALMAADKIEARNVSVKTGKKTVLCGVITEK